MRCRAYLTDEGFGPLVRFSAVLEQLRRRMPELEVEIQTYNHVEFFSSLTDRVMLRKRHNLVRWHRHPDGRPDLDAIRVYFADYEKRSRQYVETHLSEDRPPSFVISDFVYEAFEIAHVQRVPSIGIAHFTWDWFFSKLYPNPVPATVIERWRKQTDLATALFFPDFTPEEIFAYHPDAVRVPLIVRQAVAERLTDLSSDNFNIMIVDSGAGVLRASLQRVLSSARPKSRFRFFVREELAISAADDVVIIPRDRKLMDLMPSMDLVIGRAGFNTISECLAARVPMLLLSEAMNPEISENILAMKVNNYASFVDITALTSDFIGTVERFLEGEYGTLKRQLAGHSIRFDGAEVVADKIAEMVKGLGNAK